MTSSKRVTNAKSAKFLANVHKRGMVEDPSEKRVKKLPVGPFVLALFLFVVVGSSLLQIIRTATTSNLPGGGN